MVESMESLKVPRREVAVRILLDDGRSLEGRLYTAPLGADGFAERVVDHLNDTTQDFVPLACGDDRFLLNKSGIIAVEVPEGRDEVEGWGTGAGREVPVRLTLPGGNSLLGKVLIVMPPERARVLDYFNAAPRFFPLIGEHRVTLVHRNYVVSVRSTIEDA
jgi:hypothetical protein